jgi:tricorn protease
VSPDGKTIAFSYQGDIWTAPVGSERATRLTVDTAYDTMPRWSPDGKWLLFTSKRTGNKDVFLMSATGGQLKRLTHHSGTDVGVGWSPDGKAVLFQSNRANAVSLYQVSRKGGMPKRLVPGYWNWVHAGHWSPDGKRLLFAEGMDGYKYWWRRGYRGPNYTRLHVYDPKMHKSRQLNKGLHNSHWPMWAADGKSYYFVSEKGGVSNLWWRSLDGKKVKQLTSFRNRTKGAIRWPSINRTGTHIAFERNFWLWITDVKTGQTKRSFHLINADKPRPAVVWKHTRKVQEFSLSPDGKKLAFISEGEVFVTDANAKTSIRQLTHTPWREYNVFWGSDSLHVYYICERGNGYVLLRRSARRGAKESQLHTQKASILFARLSPNGKYVAFLNGKNKWMLLDVKSKKVSFLATGQIGGFFTDMPQWSPDSRWLMYKALSRGRSSLWAVRVGGKKKATPIRLTRTASMDAMGAWVPGGKYVLYQSNHTGSDWFHKIGGTDLYALALSPKKPSFREDRLDALFGPAKKSNKPSGKVKSSKKKGKPSATSRPAKSKKGKKKKSKKKGKKKASKAKKKAKPINIVEKGLRHRTRNVTSLRGDESWPTPSPKGKHVLFYGNSFGRTQLFRASFKKGRLVGVRPFASRLVFRSAWDAHGLTWHPKGKAAYVLHRGRIAKVSFPTGSFRYLPIRVHVKIDRAGRRVQMLREVWVVLRDHFYKANMNGLDWKAVYRAFLPVVKKAQSDEDWKDLLNDMLGLLNASHLGVYLPRKRAPYQTGSLGVKWASHKGQIWFDDVYERGPVARVLPSLVGKRARVLAIAGTSVHANMNPFALLRNVRGKRLTLKLSVKVPPAKGSKKQATWKTKTIHVKPSSAWFARRLRYWRWVKERKQLVAKWSKGRVGYLHMPDMTRPSLYRFIRDYETDVVPKASALIDIRYNFGGNVHDTVLQYLSRKKYAMWGTRGLRKWPQPSFAVLPKPIVMLINQVTLSDGEMTASGFKALKLGTLMGTATYRWLIFTYHATLLNGGFFRIPEWGCYTPGMKDLETHGVKPDIVVHNHLADRLAGRDPQLKQAVQLLLKKLTSKKKK